MNRNTLKMALILIVGTGIGYGIARHTKKIYCSIPEINENQCALRRRMMHLWSEQVMWTRQFIVSSIAGIPDTDAVTQRLFKNQDDIGNAIAPYYGNEAGQKLATLLRQHIAITADIVKAAIGKDNERVNTLDTQWHENARDIAAFLSAVNQHWTQDGLARMLEEHLALLTKELQLRLQQDWTRDIANYDKMLDQALKMGLALANGIMEQFPAKF